MAQVNYRALNRDVQEQIRYAGGTVAGFIRWAPWVDDQWHGDKCGCTDDRCIGYHHDVDEDCGCFEVLLEQYVAEKVVR